MLKRPTWNNRPVQLNSSGNIIKWCSILVCWVFISMIITMLVFIIIILLINFSVIFFQIFYNVSKTKLSFRTTGGVYNTVLLTAITPLTSKFRSRPKGVISRNFDQKRFNEIGCFYQEIYGFFFSRMPNLCAKRLKT